MHAQVHSASMLLPPWRALLDSSTQAALRRGALQWWSTHAQGMGKGPQRCRTTASAVAAGRRLRTPRAATAAAAAGRRLCS